MQPHAALRAVQGQGLEGDAAFATSRRQVLLIDSETLHDLALAPGAVRENVTLSGVSLRGLTPGTHLLINDVILEITGDCTPCEYLDTLRPGLREALGGRRGLLARVTRSGRLTVGAAVSLERPAPGAPEDGGR
jgi:MOSC domain-containing protein YiiM